MSGYTLAEATELRDAAKAAYLAALQSQQYSIGQRSQRRPDLAVLKFDLDHWSNIVSQLSSTRTGPRIWGATPL